jgi:hypothetical protein
VQSAYETLLQTAPPDPVTRHDHQSDLQQQVDPPKSAGRRSAAAEGEPVRRSPQKPQYHSTFRRKSSSSGPAEGPSQAPAEAKIDREQASGVAQMTTEQIRKSLQSIGVTLLPLASLTSDTVVVHPPGGLHQRGAGAEISCSQVPFLPTAVLFSEGSVGSSLHRWGELAREDAQSHGEGEAERMEA